ncbi:hypothetical protein NHX12_026602 [Muraenolepis orangiensis]|uniref:Uncharacterized protein n=1 Tax=Muraenolepis orangiensis TaxID=630683 RepID=A0A9Q0EIX8_9TELE|nr:hypothetical protein NHX12_026602 [Muraenolepis orangiensis]
MRNAVQGALPCWVATRPISCPRSAERDKRTGGNPTRRTAATLRLRAGGGGGGGGGAMRNGQWTPFSSPGSPFHRVHRYSSPGPRTSQEALSGY